ncbi:MAG: hypothetical protein VW405_04990 [Rhodospirillaceae bacterium]
MSDEKVTQRVVARQGELWVGIERGARGQISIVVGNAEAQYVISAEEFLKQSARHYAHCEAVLRELTGPEVVH